MALPLTDHAISRRQAMAWGLSGLATLVGIACNDSDQAVLDPPRAPRALLAQQVGLRVAALLYSGRPDPEFTVTAAPLLGELRGFLSGLPPVAAPNWPLLGPRGFVILNSAVPAFPTEVRVFRGVVRILDAGTVRFFGDVHGLEAYLRQQFTQRGIVIPAPSAIRPPQVRTLLLLPTSGSEPPYEPDKWIAAQYDNNCYNYACNKPTGTFAQPGRASNRQYTNLDDCSKVSIGSISDGLIPWEAGVACPAGYRKIALVVAPMWDFHWFRQDRDGTWSHKPGSTEVRNVDNSGMTITDPRTADRGWYDTFCHFFAAPANPALIRIR